MKNVYTVNESIASIYRNLYGVNVKVVRNVPLLDEAFKPKSRSELGLPIDRKIIVMQGSFIDPDRGGMEAVDAMKYLNVALLLVIGEGRDIQNMKTLVNENGLEDKVKFLPRLAYLELKQYTANSDLGLSLDKSVHLNYTYSLPNKLFDYIHAGVPVLITELPELNRVMDEFEIGMFAKTLEPKQLAVQMHLALTSGKRENWKLNLTLAKKKFNWQREEEVLKEIYSN